MTAVKEILLTAFGPKYSFTMSVITNSKGQSNTPQVRLKPKPLSPNKVKLAGGSPNNFSREKIFVPMDSAINALQQKKAVIPRNSFVGLLLRMSLII
jgi:hypothetical protein